MSQKRDGLRSGLDRFGSVASAVFRCRAALALFFLVGSLPLQAQASDGDIEARLAQAQGAERVALVAELLAEGPYEDPARAAELGRQALQDLAAQSDQRLELHITCGLCRAERDSGALDRALELGQRCVELATAREDKAWMAWGHLRCLARAYASQSQLGLSVVHGMRSVELYEQLDDAVKLTQALSLTGMELADLGDLTTAMDYQLRARRISEREGDLSGEALALLRIGAVHSSLGETEKATETAQAAYDLFTEVGHVQGAAAALNNLANGYMDRDELDKALELYEESLELSWQVGSRRSASIALLSIGAVYLQQERVDEARTKVEESLELARELGTKRLEVPMLLKLAEVLQRQGKLDQALATVEQATELAAELEYREYRLTALQHVAAIEEARGNMGAALAAMRRYAELKDELLNSAHAKRVAEMEVRYQAESQASEIEELKQRQTAQENEVRQQRRVGIALVISFALLLAVLALLFNRYRLKAQASAMAAAVEQEKAVSAGLREIDRLKDDFLANTSHELRTPLFGIVGLAESMLDGASGPLPAAAQRNLQLILRSGKRLSSLVEDILDSAKLRREGLELSTGPVDLHSLADVVMTLSRPLVEGRPVELRNEVPASLPPALADSDRVQQVLHNLVGNAIKFTERGAVTVSAGLVDSPDDASSGEPQALEVRVHDTGIGIAPEAQEKIFRSFEQADTSIERSYGGTGLGLAISRQLVHLHGSELKVESMAGEGSVFYFSLPVADETAGSISPDPVVVNAPVFETDEGSIASIGPTRLELGAMPGARGRILAIDDEPVNLQVLENHLVPLGHQVLRASSGSEALHQLESQSIDLILLDIMMPRMSGYKVCRHIRAQHSREALPVIFLSAKNRAPDRIAGFVEGGNDYLAKPSAKQELVQRVEAQLELLQKNRTQVEEIRVLRGLLTICSHCKKIRDDDGHWDVLEQYIDRHSEARFSHGLCPTCLVEHYPGVE